MILETPEREGGKSESEKEYERASEIGETFIDRKYN